MISKILVVAAVVLVVFAVIVAFQPSEFRVVRAATMSAVPTAVFDQVNNFHKWEAWSPWAKLDPEAKNTFDGPPAGPGAVFAWSGNKKVGEGRMTLRESHPSDLVRIQLDFIKPFASTSTTEFTFKPQGTQGNQTLVTWSMFGTNNFLGKAVCLFMNMDKAVGPDFERGLANLKAVVEAPVKPAKPSL